ncbi:DUF1616 domain-containing protein [Haloarcula sp. S1AR25-5A]|uniref:DUF1616 domain-containing protein n=1 Tax=Haloarcula terrestris TaxID=2950533 RepID=A0AAE4EYX6_9EURY|nr:DUF1616 domain-containing protein [Haloarcula terrestris]MDS0222705.1 DUF1616 domain-containing protein [Haloarcula terrestris]
MTESVEQEDRLSVVLADLVVVAILTALTGVFVLVQPLNQTLLRPALALGFLLFVPGYVFTVALLPRGRRRGTENQTTDTSETILEYLVFSFGVSVSLSILGGLALGITTVGITSARLYSTLALLTVVCLPIAAFRRLAVPPEDRFHPRLLPVIRRSRSEFSTEQPTHVLVLNLAVVVTIIIAVVSVGAGFNGNNEADLTEFYVLSENEDGEFVATDYPSTMTRGSSEPFVLGIDNQEGESIEYTVVILFQQFETVDGSETLVSEVELQTIERTVENNETAELNVSVTPPTAGQNHRLTYLLYTEQPPSYPSTDNAYREVHIWVDIESQ